MTAWSMCVLFSWDVSGCGVERNCPTGTWQQGVDLVEVRTPSFENRISEWSKAMVASKFISVCVVTSKLKERKKKVS